MPSVLRKSWLLFTSSTRPEGVDLGRLAHVGLLVLPVALALGALAFNFGSASYGFDFHGGMWKAAYAIRAGESPYPPPDAGLLGHQLNAFVPPPVLAFLAVPFTLVPWTAAIVAWNLVCVGAMLLALRLVGVRDWRLSAFVLCSLPFVSSLGFGQPEGVLCLGVAIAWRWRTSWRGALAVGVIVAAKLIVWPLIIWLLAARRFREAAVAAASAVGLAALSWAVIGFDGLSAYPRLLSADAHAFARRTHSIGSFLLRIGVSAQVSELLTIVGAGTIVLAIVHRARGTDRGLFVAAMAFSLLASPLLEMHYLTLALITLAIARPRFDLVWLLAVNVFWLSPVDAPAWIWQIPIVLIPAVMILVRAADPELPRIRAATLARRALVSGRAEGERQGPVVAGPGWRSCEAATD